MGSKIYFSQFISVFVFNDILVALPTKKQRYERANRYKALPIGQQDQSLSQLPNFINIHSHGLSQTLRKPVFPSLSRLTYRYPYFYSTDHPYTYSATVYRTRSIANSVHILVARCANTVKNFMRPMQYHAATVWITLSYSCGRASHWLRICLVSVDRRIEL